MTVSLIITTYNWKEALEMVLKSVLIQTVLPDEVIIADDGSRNDTKELIENFQKQFSIPLIHSWQEDKGFRLAASRNRAISKSSCEYIIVIDGDMILDKRFVENHIRYSSKGKYLQGSRVLMTEEYSKKLFSMKKFRKPSFFSKKMGNRQNSLYIPFLTNIFIKKESKDLNRIRGCNFSLYKDDIYLVNGFNEDFTTWGKEDSEFVQRLYNADIKRINLKFASIQYHIYHKEGKACNNNIFLLENTINNNLKWCENGINKYLKGNNES